LDAGRLAARRGLLGRLDAHAAGEESHETYRVQAFDLLTSAESKRAFDLEREPPAVRDRYGNDINCQSVLMARRLVEAGVPFVCVHWIDRQVGPAFIWDTHGDNFGRLKDALLPRFDACYSALLEDLEVRGLLDETLVVVA